MNIFKSDSIEKYPWGYNRRFNAYANYFEKHFGKRVQKVAIDAGFTCPNRDGTLGIGGCTFCNNNAFNPSYCNPDISITDQIKEGIIFHHNRYRRATNYLAYFQAYSNTYAPLEKLKTLYNEAINYPGVIGLVIGTRPDCIDDEKLDYFEKLTEKLYIVIEYGVESINNNTLKKINRGHTFDQSAETIEKTAARGINTGAHFIFGLPGESKENIFEWVKIISKLKLHSIKFHQLQIIRNTKMAEEFKNHPGEFYFFGLDEYINFIVDFVEKLNPAFMIERIAGEAPPRFLAGHNWGQIRNYEIMDKFEKRLKDRNTWQGRLYNV